MIEYRVGQGRLHSLLLPALTSKPKGGLQLRRLPDPRGPTLKAIATSYNRGHHRLAVILACWTFLLIIAGALVTSNDAGLSVPDWPTSFGSWYKIPKLVGGVKFEHTHRMIAQGAGLLTIILAVWTWRTEKRRWMRVLGFGALGMVIVQGILGGLTVKLFLPPPVSSAHAALAQTFFCLTVAFALFTGQKWVEEQPQVEYDQRRPSLFTLTLLSIFVLYVQLILGAMFLKAGDADLERLDTLRRYYDPYATLAREHGLGFVLESPTWRASPRWAAQLGYTDADLRQFNRRAIELMEEVRDAHAWYCS